MPFSKETAHYKIIPPNRGNHIKRKEYNYRNQNRQCLQENKSERFRYFYILNVVFNFVPFQKTMGLTYKVKNYYISPIR